MGRAIEHREWGRAALCAAALALMPAAAVAQEGTVAAPPAPPPTAPVQTSAPHCPPAADNAGVCIPALTPVRIRVLALLGSKISTSGAEFPLELAQPIVIDGKELVPAGTRGMGEVVHAKKSGGAGAAGELVLAARYLELGERRLRLRSLSFAKAGEDSIRGVNNAAIASSVVFPPLALIGFFVKGKGIEIPAGAEAGAKTAEPFVLDAAPALPAEPAQLPTPVSSPPTQGTANEP